MPAISSREVRLAARPVGMPKPSDFALAEAPAPEPKDGEIQVRNLWMSVDPYMRGRMIDRKSYVPPFEVGKPLEGGAIGEVTASKAAGFAAGDLVSTMRGWREAFTASPADALAQKIDPQGLPPQAFLGVAGMPGLTAYAGLLRVGALKEGETVFVSAAAGAVGSIVCQIAKIKGARVIGAAGGSEKAAYLRELGVDHVIDYKAHPDWRGLIKALREGAPKGVDVYFENVGGDHLTAALEAMAMRGRIVVCGLIAGYNDAEPRPGPHNLFNVIGKRLRMEGFIVFDHLDMAADFERDMAAWIKAGRLTWRESVAEGIAAAPEAFLRLFSGDKIGKMLVKLA